MEGLNAIRDMAPVGFKSPVPHHEARFGKCIG